MLPSARRNFLAFLSTSTSVRCWGRCLDNTFFSCSRWPSVDTFVARLFDARLQPRNGVKNRFQHRVDRSADAPKVVLLDRPRHEPAYTFTYQPSRPCIDAPPIVVGYPVLVGVYVSGEERFVPVVMPCVIVVESAKLKIADGSGILCVLALVYGRQARFGWIVKSVLVA
uniref:Putative secreted protein n=1 Tax=Ixodes ricinus TaxID=34613 RepID=A0A6B0UXW8_IXORI